MGGLQSTHMKCDCVTFLISIDLFCPNTGQLHGHTYSSAEEKALCATASEETTIAYQATSHRLLPWSGPANIAFVSTESAVHTHIQPPPDQRCRLTNSTAFAVEASSHERDKAEAGGDNTM